MPKRKGEKVRVTIVINGDVFAAARFVADRSGQKFGDVVEGTLRVDRDVADAIRRLCAREVDEGERAADGGDS